jgi:hypothetical protein
VEGSGFWNLMDFRRRLRTITHLKQVKPNSAHHGPNSKTVAAVLASLIGGRRLRFSAQKSLPVLD